MWEVHSLFQSEFSPESDRVLPLSRSSYLLLLKVIQYLHTFSLSSSHPFHLSVIMCVRRHFLCKMWTFSLPSFLYVGCFFPPWLYVIRLYFSRDGFNWSYPSYSSTTILSRYFCSIFQNVIFQHHTKLCSKCSTSVVSCLSSSPVCWWKESSSYWMLLFSVEILGLLSHVHLASFAVILPKYLKFSTFCSCFCFIIICTGDNCLEILITLVSSTFIFIPFYLPTSVSLSVMPCIEWCIC